MRWVNSALLKNLLSQVVNNPHSGFYAKKYAGLPVDEEHFFDLPPLTRAELVATPLSKRTFVPHHDVRFAAFTSGTSAQQPLITLFSDIANYHFEPSLGLAITRPLIIYPPLNKNFGHTFIQQCRQAKHPVSPIFADFQNLQNSALIAKATLCDSLYATPTIAALFAPYAREKEIANTIKLLILSSETLTSARRSELGKLYPKSRIANLYASSEIGQFVMAPCKHMIESGENSLHVIADALAAVELVEGELFVTYGLNKAMPLIRYETGDYFEELSTTCACGRQGPILRWSHRREVDRLRINGVEFDVEEADRAFGRLSRPAAHYQVHFKENPAGGVALVVEIEHKILSNASEQHLLARALESELLDSWRLTSGAVMRDALVRGLFSSFSVVLVPELTVRAAKAKRFVNHVR